MGRVAVVFWVMYVLLFFGDKGQQCIADEIALFSLLVQ